jgi:hypothetical protein
MGAVGKKAVLIPLKEKSDHHSFFLMGDDGDPPAYMPGVYLQLVEWPRTLVVSEIMDNALALGDLPDGVTLEVVRIPGNRSPGNYQVGCSVMRFESGVVMRKFARMGSVIELGLVIDCTVSIL